MKYIILGVDPGKTIGVACLDLNGRKMFTAHYQNAGLEFIIEKVAGIGVPVIVASDKERAGEFVKKVNASFGAKLFTPKKEINSDAKRQIGRDAMIANPHERDAYTAAIIAYNAYSNKFNQIEHLAGKGDDADAIKRKVVLKRSIYEILTGRESNRH